MGKSFVVQTYIKKQIEDPDVRPINYGHISSDKSTHKRKSGAIL